ncbi:hypothetical protein EYR40_000387 [Pleurotus pulmonarius]|nr:hypothetical protein EYR36_001256 [Pleurotus pulmonarius]KAF4608045.1 hypothetical protein EYR40_000387 [Pleurotus pulmonarius]
MTSTPKRLSIRVPFSADGTPTVITLPWLGPPDAPEPPQVKTEGRPSDVWAGLPQTPQEYDLFRLSESLTPVPETPPRSPVVVASQLRRSSRVASLSSFNGLGSTIAGTSVSRAKGKDRHKSKSKGSDARSVTPAPASTQRGKSAGRRSGGSDRYEPYPSIPSRFSLASHKINNIKTCTRWFPITSTHPLRTPPITRNNEDRLQVNDLCINHLKGSGALQSWIWTVDQEWVKISPGDSCAIDGVTRFLRLNADGSARWVTRLIHNSNDTPVSVIPSAPISSSSTLDTDASAASLY